jgi:hypothetical protein
VLGHVGEERDDVVVGGALDLIDALDLERGGRADVRCLLGVIPISPSSACASQASTSISRQISNLFSSSQMRAISGRE